MSELVELRLGVRMAGRDLRDDLRRLDARLVVVETLMGLAARPGAEHAGSRGEDVGSWSGQLVWSVSRGAFVFGCIVVELEEVVDRMGMCECEFVRARGRSPRVSELEEIRRGVLAAEHWGRVR